MNFRKIGNGIKWTVIYLVAAIGVCYVVALMVVFSPLIFLGWAIERGNRDYIKRCIKRGELP